MIRLKLTPKDDTILLEWVEIENEVIGETVFTEEVAFARAGCSYVSRVAIDEGQLLPGTFWVDEAAHRHFVMLAEPGELGAVGNTLRGEYDPVLRRP